MAKYDPQKHHRRSIRLKGYDYSLAGAYFVTIVAQDNLCLFGDIYEGEMNLNSAGQMIVSEWEKLPTRFPSTHLDIYVVMPNHFHAILTILDPPFVRAPLVGAPLPSTPDVSAFLPSGIFQGETNRAGTSPAPTKGVILGNIIGAFKSITTHAYIQGVKQYNWPGFNRRLWQRNYYDHIIRNDADFQRIYRYILANPSRWLEDSLHPDAPPNRFNHPL